MTIPALTPLHQFTADGTVGPITIPWRFFDDEDLEVYAGTLQKTLTTDYTLTGAGAVNGGALTWVSGQQPAVDTVVTIVRSQISRRGSDLSTAGVWRAAVVNNQLDYMISGLQDLFLKAGLAISVSPTEAGGLELPPLTTRANKHLAFDGSGEIVMTTDAPASTIKYTDPPITLVDAQAVYALPSEVQSGEDEDNYAAWLVGGGQLLRGTDFTVAADSLTLTTTPTVANGLAGELLVVELVRPALNGEAVQLGTVSLAALAPGPALRLLAYDASGNPSTTTRKYVGEEWTWRGTPATCPVGNIVYLGQSLSATTFPELFAIFGYSEGGSGDDFYLPKPAGRGRIFAGQGNTAEGGGLGSSRVPGATGGAETHMQADDEMYPHVHPGVQLPNSNNTESGGGTNRVAPQSGNTGAFPAVSQVAMDIMNPYFVGGYLCIYTGRTDHDYQGIAV